MSTFNKVAIIGSGLMGSGIAAQIANSGTKVLLLDIVSKNSANRNFISEKSIETLLKTKPAPLMHKRNAKLITPGNIEDHMHLISECEWVCEVVVENLSIKHEIYKKIEKFCSKDTIISSNTSTIPLSKLTSGFSNFFKEKFMITHFFNPPRYMPLLEVVPGKETKQDYINRIVEFSDIYLGKEIVVCKDTPGFIANRIGIFWSMVSTQKAYDLDLTIEEADSIVGKPMGVPKTGIFGLADVVGIDLIPHVTNSMISNLAKSDPYCVAYLEQEELGISQLFSDMVDAGYTGRKGKGGFYRLNSSSGSKVKESRNLKNGNYSISIKPKNLQSVRAAKKGLRALVEYDDKGGRFAWQVLSKTLSYAASLVPEITENIVNVDIAMKNGFMWKKGPFEMLDELGPSWFAGKLKSEGIDVPEILEKVGSGSFYSDKEGMLNYFTTDGEYEEVTMPKGYLSVLDIKRGQSPIFRNPSINLWDMGDDILLAEFISKMNSIDPLIMEGLSEAASLCESGKFKGLVIGNDGTNFSAGANLGLASFICNVGAWDEVYKFVHGGQLTFMSLKHGNFPVVGASSGLALGGGCEVLLACDRVQAHSETYIGLVEVGVGVVPAWGGCKEMLRRWSEDSKSPKGPMGSIVKIFENLGTAKVASSAQEARDMKFLLDSDKITMNRSRVLHDAKETCLQLVEGYVAPEINEYNLPGPSGKAALDLAVSDLVKSGHATPHDVVVTDKLAYILTGGNTDILDKVSEDKLLEMERTCFVDLVKTEATLDRFEHMLTKGKPLRN